MMDLTEELFVSIANEVLGTQVIEYQGERIDLTPPWPRRGMLDLINDYAGVDIAVLDDEGLRAALRVGYEKYLDRGEFEDAVHGLESFNRGNMIEEFFELAVEPNLIQPTFVKDYPKEMSPLAKIHRENDALTERFELYIYGREMANAFSELNDPIDQRERFEAQMRHLAAGDEEAQPLDEDFLRALEYGMPPTGGLGIGVDRMVMLFTNQRTIQEVILFPQMRPETTNQENDGALEINP
jgi:lysyl-tRNA synthetase class 2